MSLNASNLANELIFNLDNATESMESEIPDFLKIMSDTISDYIVNNLDADVSWIAATTTTPPTSDPEMTTTAKVANLNIGWTRSLIFEMNEPSAILSILGTQYKLMIGSITFIPTDSSFQFTSSPLIQGLTVIDEITYISEVEDADYIDNMNKLAETVVSSLTKNLTLPLVGAHGPYVSTNSTITRIS